MIYHLFFLIESKNTVLMACYMSSEGMRDLTVSRVIQDQVKGRLPPVGKTHSFLNV